MASAPGPQLTGAMLDALRRMPVAVTADGMLPADAPHAGTLRALERRGLVRRLPGSPGGVAWVTTAAGRAALRDATA